MQGNLGLKSYGTAYSPVDSFFPPSLSHFHPSFFPSFSPNRNVLSPPNPGPSLPVLVSYCRVTNYHKHSDLKQHTFTISGSVGQKFVHSTAGFLFRVLPGWKQGVSSICGPICGSGFSSKLNCSWQNLVFCGCRTETPTFFLAGIQGLFWAPRGYLPSPAIWPSPQCFLL